MKTIFRHFYILKNANSKKELAVIGFTMFYIVFFTFYAFVRMNMEFLFYSLIMLSLLNLGIYIHKTVQLPEVIIIGLSFFGFMHIMGGNIWIGDTRLYDTLYFNGIVRYDNIVHLVGTALTVLSLNSIFFHFVDERDAISYHLFYLSLVLMALGVGAINEVLELIAVVFMNASELVGDYYNNTIDLVLNTVGALLAIILIDIHREYMLRKDRLWRRFLPFK